jgi:putative transposase
MEAAMRKKREFVEGAACHGASRANDRKRAFERNAGRKTMPLVIRDAKNKFGFTPANFCITPTHIHPLITPGKKGSLSRIMHWIETHSAKRWSRMHGSTDHLWGAFRPCHKRPAGLFFVMEYIDQNPIKAGLSRSLGEWKASGAYYIRRNVSGMVGYTDLTRLSYASLSPTPTVLNWRRRGATRQISR